MLNLVRGYRGKLTDVLDDGQPFRVVMHTEGRAIYDSCCFGVDAAGKLSDDRYMVFYNQTASPGNAVCLTNSGRASEYTVDLNALPPQIDRLVFTVSIDGSGTMGEVVSHRVSLEQSGSLGAGLTLSGKDFERERAIIDIEIYRKNGWRFSAIARGFDGGLKELLKSYGGEPIETTPPPPPAPKALRPAPSSPAKPKEQRPAPKVQPRKAAPPKPMPPEPVPPRPVNPPPQRGVQMTPPPNPQPQYGSPVNPQPQPPQSFSPNKQSPQELFGNSTPEQLYFAQNNRAPMPNHAPQYGGMGNPPQSPNPQYGGMGNPPQNPNPQYGGQRSAATAFADDTQIADRLMKKINLSKDKVKLEKHVVNLSKCVVDLSKKSGVDLGNTRAKVVVALDFSGSMSRLYSNGTVQDTINRLVPLGLTFDDNGSIDMFLFQSDYRKMPDLNLSNYEDYVQSVIRLSGYTMGGTNYFPVLQAIIEGTYVSKGFFRGREWVPPIVDGGDPTFILFITDGENADQSMTNNIIRKSSEMNVFIQFIGIGNTTFRYLEQLDDMEGRRRDNTGFSKMADLAAADDNLLYTNVLEQFSKWLRGLQ